MASSEKYGGAKSPSKEELIALREVAAGKRPADLAIRGGRVVHVHTGEIREADVLIHGHYIAAVTDPGRFEAVDELDATGRYVAPTFIDSHLHIEYTMLTPGELARLSVPRGTTTLLVDPNCIANVNGMDGVNYIRKTETPLRIFLQATSRAPRRPGLELGGQTLSLEEIKRLLHDPDVISLGEAGPFALDEESAELNAVALAAGKRINGHTARLSGVPLWSYIAGGIGDDHNAANLGEVLELNRLGLHVAIQLGSMTDYIKDVLGNPEALGSAAHHLFFGADDKHVVDLAKYGHIDHHVRSAVKNGIDPAVAIRMASLNSALHFRIDHLIGSITPTRLADLQILPDLESFTPDHVFVGGKEVARDRKPLFDNNDPIPEFTRNTVRLGKGLSKEAIAVRAPEGKSKVTVRLAEMYNGYYKRAVQAELPVVDGYVVADPSIDAAKIVVLDRHHGSGKAGVGFVRNFGLRKGAIAATNNCENQNLVIIGTSDDEILAAAQAIQEIGGGYAVVADGEVVGTVPLPVSGIMSDQPWETVVEQTVELERKAREIGVTIESPFMILAFVGLSGVPDLGLTELGLIDVYTQEFVPVVVDPVDQLEASGQK